MKHTKVFLESKKMNKGKIRGMKLIIYICIVYVICFSATYELSWLLHFAKSDLIKIEATKVGISTNRAGSRFSTYQTMIKYKYGGESYEEEILTDARDWKKDKITIYIEEDHPKRIYREKYLLIPISPASIGALIALLLTLFFAIRLDIMKKEDVKDFKIPNP